jgi:hypothetical protein
MCQPHGTTGPTGAFGHRAGGEAPEVAAVAPILRVAHADRIAA